jgi:hypothetical protein
MGVLSGRFSLSGRVVRFDFSDVNLFGRPMQFLLVRAGRCQGPGAAWRPGRTADRRSLARSIAFTRT